MNMDQNGQGMLWGSCPVRVAHEPIPGLRYVPQFLSEEESAELLQFLGTRGTRLAKDPSSRHGRQTDDALLRLELCDHVQVAYACC